MFEVVIVGGGVAGVSAAHHLLEAGVRGVCLLERGAVGEGVTAPSTVGPNASLTTSDDEKFGTFELSGTACLPSPFSTVKMMLTSHTAPSTADFIRHHGEDGPRRFFEITTAGISIQVVTVFSAFDVANHILWARVARAYLTCAGATPAEIACAFGAAAARHTAPLPRLALRRTARAIR